MAQLFTEVKPTKQMGRKTLKRAEPTNTELVTTLKRENPDKEFVVCVSCGDWALVWPGDPYEGMHPMGCYDTPRGQRLAAEKKRAAKKAGSTESLFGE